MMGIPPEDIQKWKTMLKTAAPATVLREMAKQYNVTRSTLGFMLADLNDEVSTTEVQTVWGWDIQGNGRGLSDDELNRDLAPLFRTQN